MKVFVVVAAVSAAFASGAVAEAPTSSPEAQQATVIKKVVKRPPKVARQKGKLSIPTKPSVAEVLGIINHEAALWQVPAASLSRRTACESHYHWWATNGQYEGVLQFAPGTFYRGMRTIGNRLVKVKHTRTRSMASRVYRYWSDGRVTRSDGRIVRQTVVMTRRGYIPRNPPANHTWAQVRIAAQALRGISAVHSSEWSCGA